MSKKYIMLELDDEKLKILTDVLSNKTSKKILEYLADKEASEGEISNELKLPANTVNYNIKNLIEAGLIESSKNWMWSVKGKKVLKYKVANKKIIISPKNSNTVKSILGALILTGISAFIVKIYSSSVYQTANLAEKSADFASSSGGAGSVGNVAPMIAQTTVSNSINFPQIWAWFLAGGIIALILFMILNWRKLE
ncbi:MAG: helix-turn-helix domain-containing protein [Nanoarchaeota archaeon]